MKQIPVQVGNFIIGDEIDSGAFGVCHYAKHIQTNQLCCVKIVSQSEETRTEIEILSKILHPNIVSLIDVEEFCGFYFIFMELCEGSTLLDILNAYAPLPEEVAKFIFGQIVLALEYLHSKGISHGDIKLENIICSSDNKVKLIDFGFASEDKIQNKFRGSVNYSAPEILSFIPFDGKKADMWSAGVCLFAMISGILPFYEEETANTISRVKNRDFKIPEFISREAKYLIKSLLQYLPESRMAAKEVLKYEWMMICEYEDSKEKYEEIICFDESNDIEMDVSSRSIEIEC
jgi:BR serine/threonine kinase